jgi:hypothetical protein
VDKRAIYTIFVLIFIGWQSVKGQKTGIDLHNQIIGWAGCNFSHPLRYQTGARYIPTLSPWWKLGKNSKLDAEISINTYGNPLFKGLKFDTAYYDFKPYRLWFRYSTSNFELRAGLQKINFGSASILRPLMWFDKIDYRDPLQLTDGVYGLLGRYYFNNNINIWIWSLYGNKNIKGWELVPSVKKVPEYGGRFQLPVPKGEIAVSYHHRRADYSKLFAGLPPGAKTTFSENRIAVDGKWDLGIGLWFEYSRNLNDKHNQFMSRWETYYNIGLDYTFSLGKGLNLISEFFHYDNNPAQANEKTKRNYSILALSYPLSLSHNISSFVYYNWETREWYNYLNFQLKYDYISLYFMAFWNPDVRSFYSSPNDNNIFAGKGIQIMLVLDI